MTTTRHKYLILGAGPGGLQMAYFLERAGRDYVVLEAEDHPGSFFDEQPRHRKLLSINKRYNCFDEPDFNLRHDWNSLLSDDPDLLFTKYSEALFPDAAEFVRYLADYAKKLSLRIEYGTRVVNIQKQGDGMFRLTDQHGTVRTCECLLLATGALASNVPDVPGIELCEQYADYNLDRERFINKRVAILGAGNSAFEVADDLAGHAGIVRLFTGGPPVRHAWQTHYVGDLRAVNNQVIDMYQLKSLHGTLGRSVTSISRNEPGMLDVSFTEDLHHWDPPRRLTFTEPYDHVICCTGWRYIQPEIFDPSARPAECSGGRYPSLDTRWESSIPNLFFIGTAMGSRDRRAASGFIHGFRYNIRTLFHLLEQRFFREPLPGEVLGARDLDALTELVVRRVSTSSGLYQLNGFLCDVITFNEDSIRYCYELPVDHVKESREFGERPKCVVTLEYGFASYEPGMQSVDFVHPADVFRPECSAFLHPVVRFYRGSELRETLHFRESLEVRYDSAFQQSNHGAFKNLVNRHLHLDDKTYSEEIAPPEQMKQYLSELPPHVGSDASRPAKCRN